MVDPPNRGKSVPRVVSAKTTRQTRLGSSAVRRSVPIAI